MCNKTNYCFGLPECGYGEVLDFMSTTKVNSWKTSSLPLTDFSKSTNEKREQIEEKVANLRLSDSTLCFEYPTFPRKGGHLAGLPFRRGASMTDIMIISDRYRIAIEGKYSEYIKDPAYGPTVADWYKGHEKKGSIKNDSKKSWYSFIRDMRQVNNMKEVNTIPYQFLHRVASACFPCSNTRLIPIVCYQLFYDNFNSTKEKMQKFERVLKEAYESLGLTLRFLIWEVEISNALKVRDQYKDSFEGLFLEMKNKEIFEFGESKIIDIKDIHTD